jgi:hypothetical protein
MIYCDRYGWIILIYNAFVPHANSLITAGKVPGAWLIQIKDAGHAVMDQYPDEVSRLQLQALLTGT